jgi:hypothetical protein
MTMVETRKRRGRPPTGIGGNVGLRLYPELQAGLDAYIAGQPDPKPSRPEAIRALLRDSLGGRGLLKDSEESSALAGRVEGFETAVESLPNASGIRSDTALHSLGRAIAEDGLVTPHGRPRASGSRQPREADADPTKER